MQTLKDLMNPVTIYFGCYKDTGHYHWYPSPDGIRSVLSCMHEDRRNPTPWGDRIDGTLCPQSTNDLGKAYLHHLDGWTALAFWDRTVDRRPGSCSVFCIERCLWEFRDVLAAFQAAFPTIYARFPFEIVEAVEL